MNDLKRRVIVSRNWIGQRAQRAMAAPVTLVGEPWGEIVQCEDCEGEGMIQDPFGKRVAVECKRCFGIGTHRE